MGARKYTFAEKVIDILPENRDNLCIIEIGSERGEGSTTYFVNFAKEHHISFYTVDFDPIQSENAATICRSVELPVNVEAKSFCMKGEDFLANVFPSLNKRIVFLYLDNFDFIYDHIIGYQFVNDQICRYNELGTLMNNDVCKEVHLLQATLALPVMSTNSYILCDDTFRKNDKYDGKCGAAVPFLLQNGWDIVEHNDGSASHSDGYYLLSCA